MNIFKRFFVFALLASLAQGAAAKGGLDDFENTRLLVEISINWQKAMANEHQSAMRAAGLEPAFEATARAAPNLSNLAQAVEADRVVFETTGRTPQMMSLLAQLKAAQEKANVARISDYVRIRSSCGK